MSAKTLIAKQKAIVESAKAEHRDMSKEEEREFNFLQGLIDDAKKDAETAQKAANDAEKRAVEAERQRVSEINDLCKSFDGVDASEYIRSGKSIDEVRAAVLNTLKEQKAPVRASVIEDDTDKFRMNVENGLLQRTGHKVESKSDYAHVSLKDIAKECLERDGENVRHISDTDLYDRVCQRAAYFNPSDSFPAIMDSVINKSIVDVYQHVPTTFDLWTTKGSLPDFKETSAHEYVFGGIGDWEEVPENGEIKADKPQTEMLPQKKLKTYGKSFTMSRQAFVNDDIGFLSRVPGAYAAKAKQTIDKQVYDILLGNSKFADGVALFDKKHGNVASTGAKPGIDSLKDMVLTIGAQTDQFGEPISVQPKYILVSNANQFDLFTTLHTAQVTGSNNNDVNPFYNASIQPIVVNRIDMASGTGATPWFVVADPMSAPSIEVDYLNGAETPQVRRMEKPNTLGFVWDMYLDWGITIVDFRGIYKNGGAK